MGRAGALTVWAEPALVAPVGQAGWMKIMVNIGYGESKRAGQHWFESCSVLKLSAAPWPFCVALSPSVTDTRPFIFCTFYDFFLLEFLQWLSARWQFEPLTLTSVFHCFGALGVGPGGQTRALVRALADGLWLQLLYSLWAIILALIFSCIVKNTENTKVGFDTF